MLVLELNVIPDICKRIILIPMWVVSFNALSRSLINNTCQGSPNDLFHLTIDKL